MSDLGFYICKECEELQVRQFAELEEIQFDHDQSNTFEEPPVTAPKGNICANNQLRYCHDM